ncbi:MAG: carbohydrate deacetylase [Armatimonadota bacterium]
MGKYLIVNADGYGFTPGINRGIEEAVARGIITSISVNSNFDPIEDLPQFVRTYPHISVGVHLNPVVGRPIAEASCVPSLVDGEGYFHYHGFTERLLHRRIDAGELEYELTLQIERVREMGVRISHLDSHQNQHLYPAYFPIFMGLLKRHSIPCMRTHVHYIPADSPRPGVDRWRLYLRNPGRLPTHLFTRWMMFRARRQGAIMADWLLTTMSSGNKADLSRWRQLLRNVPEGWSEVYCHPAYPDDELRRWATYVEPRRQEIEVMTSPETREEVERQGIELKSFHDLYRAKGTVPEVLRDAGNSQSTGR